MLLGATSGAAYAQADGAAAPGDLLVLHTDGLVPRRHAAGGRGAERLLALAPRFAAARTAQDCVRMVVEEFGAPSARTTPACWSPGSAA